MIDEADRADTRMMGIVHGALRRDLLRTRDALTAVTYPRGRRRHALGEHVVWLMEFLHAHHTSEDEGLWPLVRRRNPAAGALLDSLEADHLVISPAAAALGAAGRRYAATSADEPRADLVAALDALTSVLFPHLDREVEEAMPAPPAWFSRCARRPRPTPSWLSAGASVSGGAGSTSSRARRWWPAAPSRPRRSTGCGRWSPSRSTRCSPSCAAGPPQQYESWLADVIERLLPGPDQRD